MLKQSVNIFMLYIILTQEAIACYDMENEAGHDPHL